MVQGLTRVRQTLFTDAFVADSSSNVILNTFRSLERVAAVLTKEGSHFPVLLSLVSSESGALFVWKPTLVARIRLLGA